MLFTVVRPGEGLLTVFTDEGSVAGVFAHVHLEVIAPGERGAT